MGQDEMAEKPNEMTDEELLCRHVSCSEENFLGNVAQWAFPNML